MRIDDFSWRECREFLETNGLGGYCSSTIIGLNTRKYHGLLVAGFSPEDKRVMLSKLDEEITYGKKTYKISTNQYWDAIEPEGYRFQKYFEQNPLPKFVFEAGGAKLEKTVFMPHGFNATVISYKASADVKLKANLLVTSRDTKWVLRDPDWDFQFSKPKGVILTPTHLNPPTICIHTTQGELIAPPQSNRVYKVFYRTELKRGYDCLDDLFIGATFEVDLKKGREVFIVCSASISKKEAQEICEKIVKDPNSFKSKEIKRRQKFVNDFYSQSKTKPSEDLSLLLSGSDKFLLDNKIIAGYPFFGVWGRDTLISLPGLCLTTGRKKDFEIILTSLLKEKKKGVLPNNFIGGKDYGSLDTALWLFWAIELYLKKTKDYGFVKKIFCDLEDIIKTYQKISDNDGLIISSCPGATWMDATIGSPVTPRVGKPVEVQALWYNALKVMEKLSKKFKKESTNYARLANKAKKSFNEKFYNKHSSYLYDVVDENDGAVRPNALFAISLPYPVLDKEHFKTVVDVAEKDLLTPYGIRTLSPRDSRYMGSAQGNQYERDLAYHQGTAWPWLMGTFVDAYKKTYPKKKTDRFTKALLLNLYDGGIGCISEVFDGSSPNRQEGCINQAWSVSELIRIIFEK